MKNSTESFVDSILNAAFTGVKNVENAQPVNELLDKYGLNWTVSKQPLLLPTGESTPFFGIVRDDNKSTFSTCKDGYQALQNSELAEMLIRLSEKTGYELHNGGLFNGGGKVYMQLSSPNKIQGIGVNNDVVKGYLTGLNSHDGSSSLKWGETNITISCRNTFMAAMRAVKSSARHTASMHARIEQAIREINNVVTEEKTLFDTFIKLSEVPMSKAATAQIVKEITEVDINLTKSEIIAQSSTYAVNRMEELMTAIAGETKEKGATMWGLLSGVTKYTTHTLPVPKRDNARLESIYTGTAYAINNKALAAITSLAGLN